MGTPEKNILDVNDLTVSYDKKPVLWNINFSIPKGKIVGIMGPNGAGKSTLIKAIMELLPLSSGIIKVFGKNLNSVRKSVAYVPQRTSVDWDFPTTVHDVVMMGRYPFIGLLKRPKVADYEIVDNCIKNLGLTNLKDRQIAELSGGQQQRVFLARALAQEADLYIMDEPFAGVDASTEAIIIDLFKKMKDAGKTVIVVHHDLQTAAEYFDWLVLLNQRLIANGPFNKVFSKENLSTTYGGKLTLLTHLANHLQKADLPNRVE
ncbi:metal ABC transporter ATP-binding protein [Cyclobacteriaceae bacterium]|nr:metal ABC transporter ATP-binding protein [Cyclobacteriaceae bacterium]